jgi:Cu-Zn family superoxide dismutase
MTSLRAELGGGEVTFHEAARGGGVDVTLRDVCVPGLSDGLHGFHVHERGDVSEGCASMGAHYDPARAHRHGGMHSSRRHGGDLGNVRSQGGCVQSVTIHAPDLTLDGVRGRGVVLHEREDDIGRGGTEESHTTGSAGARVACGTIVQGV